MPGRQLRADAQRNRDKLLAAANAVFTECGAAASMEEIARRAKVGIGTLYRHFPTREALLAATFDERLLALAAASRTRAKVASAAASLAIFLEQLVRQSGRYSGLAASWGMVLQSGSPGCHATTEAGKELLARAQADGDIRRDARFDDVVCMATAISLAVSQDPSDVRRSHRLVAMFVDGLKATATKKPRSRSQPPG